MYDKSTILFRNSLPNLFQLESVPLTRIGSFSSRQANDNLLWLASRASKKLRVESGNMIFIIIEELWRSDPLAF